MSARELQDRAGRFSQNVFQAWRSRLRSVETKHVAGQVIRSASSIAANYRACRLSRSKPEFIAKMGNVREEADETVYWLEFARTAGLYTGPDADKLTGEARELSAIFSAAYRTARRRANEK